MLTSDDEIIEISDDSDGTDSEGANPPTRGNSTGCSGSGTSFKSGLRSEAVHGPGPGPGSGPGPASRYKLPGPSSSSTQSISSDSDEDGEPVELMEDENEKIDEEEEVELMEDDPWLDYDSEPDLECDSWDDDCSIFDIKPETCPIIGFHLMPSCQPEMDQSRKRSKISVQLNDAFDVSLLNEKFREENPFESENFELIVDPWRAIVFDEVLSEPSFLDSLRDEFYELVWNERRMDLYEFYQSEDLKRLNTKYVNAIREFLNTELKTFVETLTGMEFTDTSATCSFYSDTDYLLVHDDQNEDRAIAFVLYLNPVWKPEWGGALRLYDRDENHQPNEPTRKILPRNNRLVLFPVTDRSYHMVEEVTCKNYCRLSVNGWYHVKEPPVFEQPLYKTPSRGILSEKFEQAIEAEGLVERWINNLHPGSLLNEDQSVGQFAVFSTDEIKRLDDALRDKELIWNRVGPPNRRNYEVLDDTHASLPETIASFLTLFKSKNFFDFLAESTELELTGVKMEIQRWKAGCYSLLGDEPKTRQLDALVYLTRRSFRGGKTIYVTLDEEVQEPLCVVDAEGTGLLSLVYGDTARYTCHVSESNGGEYFFIFVAQYVE